MTWLGIMYPPFSSTMGPTFRIWFMRSSMSPIKVSLPVSLIRFEIFVDVVICYFCVMLMLPRWFCTHDGV